MWDVTKSTFLYTATIVAGIVGLGLMVVGLRWVPAKVLPATSVDPGVTTLMTLVGGFVGVALTKGLERRKEIELKLREQKVKAYDDALTVVFEALDLHKRGALTDQIGGKMMEIARNLILWGSDSTIKDFLAFKELGTNAKLS